MGGLVAGSVAFGAAGAGHYLAPTVGPKVAGWWPGEGAEWPARRNLADPRNYRVRVNPNKLGMNGGNADMTYVGPRSAATHVSEAEAAAGDAVKPQLALPYRPTTNTLAQVRATRQRKKWQAGEQYVRELYGAGPERRFPVPPGMVIGEAIEETGERFVDAPVDTPSGGVVATEVMNSPGFHGGSQHRGPGKPSIWNVRYVPPEARERVAARRPPVTDRAATCSTSARQPDLASHRASIAAGPSRLPSAWPAMALVL